MTRKSNKTRLFDGRTLKELRNQYEVEKTFAERLKKATRNQRKVIYERMYDEIFERVPDHPRLKRRENPRMTTLRNKSKFKLIRKFIDKSTVFVEFGPGDCRFAMRVCDYVKHVYAMDISDQHGELDNVPSNFELIVYDGYDVGTQESFADIVFSDQLIEHLHPDDVKYHFQLVRKILKPQGVYICQTPHRFSGPHDVSRYFSDEAEGLHLHEWTYSEMAKTLKNLEYSSWHAYWYAKGIRVRLPFVYFIIMEHILNVFPKRLRRIISKYPLPNITMMAIK